MVAISPTKTSMIVNLILMIILVNNWFRTITKPRSCDMVEVRNMNTMTNDGRKPNDACKKMSTRNLRNMIRDVQTPDLQALYDKFNKVTDNEEKQFYHDNPIVINEGISIRHRSMFEFLSDVELTGLTSIDLGCGTGHLVNWLTQKVKSASGIDLSSDHIEFGKRIYPNINIIQKSLFEVEGKYDLISITDVFEHIRFNDHQLIMNKLKSISKIGSLVYMNQPSAVAVMNIQSQIIDNPIKISYIINLFDNNGFKIQIVDHWNIDYYHLLFMVDQSYD